MYRNNSLQWAELDITRQGEPFSARFEDRYYSRHGALKESEYVFLEQNGLPGSWVNRAAFAIGEVGFGTGLNFLTVLKHWRKTKSEGAMLRFVSIEKYPLLPVDFKKLSKFDESGFMSLMNPFLRKYEEIQAGWNYLCFPDEHVILELFIGDAFEGLQSKRFKVDAWFYDGFAPDKNPELWNDDMFKEIALHSQKGTTISTFTAAGFVRRGLQRHGFQMEKVKGFGPKRDMIRGVWMGI